MSKKKRKDKKTRKHKNIKAKLQKPDEQAAVTIGVRPDLRKTIILTAVCLGILFLLYLTQSRWSGVLK